MRLAAALGLIVLALGVWGLVDAGVFDRLVLWAAEEQRRLQQTLAGAIRALRAGEPGALAALLLAAGGYGLVHSAGPGHGKLLIGGASLASRATHIRMAWLALASSLAQAVWAIVLVYGALSLLEIGARSVSDAADTLLAPVSYGLIATVGLVLAWRGVDALGRWRSRPAAPCGCGHAHGPSAEEAARALSLRDQLALVGSIAVRPCTGAIFVLAIAWRLDLAMAGALAALTMGLGTAVFTGGVAVAGVSARGLALFSVPERSRLALAFPLVQIGAGSAVFLLSGGLLLASI